MSLADRVAALETQVSLLQASVQRLAAAIENSSSEFVLVGSPRSSRPETRRSGSAPLSPRSETRPSGSAQAPAPTTPARSSQRSAETLGSLGFSPDPRPSGSREVALTPRSRGAACREVGLFLRSATDGAHRGPSGRERLPGGSRYWIVTRDYDGELLDPVGVFTRFADCKALVKRGSDLGASVCIGVPSRGDLIAVCAAAGIALPSQW